MPNFSRTVTVSSDIDSAFGFLSDFRNLEKWAEGDEGELITKEPLRQGSVFKVKTHFCLLYTSPSPRDISGSRMPSSA